MNCDAWTMCHNNRTSSENPQNIIDHITTFTYHIISSICISQCITLWPSNMVQQVHSVTSPKYSVLGSILLLKKKKKIRPLVQPLEFYMKLVLSSFTVIYCFRFVILYHTFSCNIEIDTCIFLLQNGALWDIYVIYLVISVFSSC